MKKEPAGVDRTEKIGSRSADVVICGAGIAGISAAYHLSVRKGIQNVLLVDEHPPLSVTSDKSTECYRNFWPGPGDAMVRLMNRSIDLLEELARESGNLFHLNRRGYLYVTADPGSILRFRRAAEESAGLGAGPLRVHMGGPQDPHYVPSADTGFEDQPDGIDVILDRAMIRKHFPCLSERVVAAIHARRCGWFSVQQLGMYMLDRAKEHGVRFLSGRVEGIDVTGNRVQSVRIRSEGGLSTVPTRHYVVAAGPRLKEAGRMMGMEFPVFSELHLKISFRDLRGSVPREIPMLIWSDPIRLPWSEEERRVLSDSEETKGLLEELPSGVHTRPEGGPDSNILLGLWAYDVKPVDPVFPFAADPNYPEMVLRGLSTMVPDLTGYLGRLPKVVVDGGYYTKTRENRPLIGKLPVEGAYVIAALSGFGVMAACGAGDLLAAHVAGGDLPPYASAFGLERYSDPGYQRLLSTWGEAGQL
jgi:glycine/D-amino acid oxidase-like deaminating enzyme